MEKQYLDDDEERRARKAKRIAEMKRQKRKQERFRKMFKIYAAVGVIVLAAAIGLTAGIASLIKNSSAENSKKEVAEGETAVEYADSLLNESEIEFTEVSGQGEATIADGEKEEVSSEAEAVPETRTNPAEDVPAALFAAETTVDTAYVRDENVISSYVVLIDVDKQEIIAEKEAKTIINPASMTKILTVLTAAEHITDLDDTFTITREITDYSYSNDCSAVGFGDGETVTVRDLMYGTILPSGADAAAGLAMYVSGSLEGFVDLMNQKLDELGLSETAHFTNCVGLYDENHYCTVYDMAVILEAAVSNELCKEVLSAHTYTTSATEQHPEGITISNWFLRRIEDKETPGEVMCAKTGFVNQSGNCAASYEETENGHYICVTANAHSSWRAIYDHVEIYNKYTQ